MNLVWWATFILVANLGHCSDVESDAAGQETLLRESWNDVDYVPDYVQKIYKGVSSIPDGSDVKDLSVFAIKPHKEKVLSHDRVSYKFDGAEEIFQGSVNQVEFVLNDNYNQSDDSRPIALRVCLNRVFCGPPPNFASVDGFLSTDLTNLAEAFLSHLKTSRHHRKFSRSISVTVEYTDHHLPMQQSQPLLVIHSVAKSNYLHLVQPQQDENQQVKSEEVGMEAMEKREKRSTEPGALYQGPCKLHPWILDFEDVGITGHVIQPQRYMANVCVGKCFGPDVQNQVRMSFHAYLREIYYRANDGNPPAISAGNTNIQVPRACCIPTKYGATSSLTLDEENVMEVKRIADATVSECGCI